MSGDPILKQLILRDLDFTAGSGFLGAEIVRMRPSPDLDPLSRLAHPRVCFLPASAYPQHLAPQSLAPGILSFPQVFLLARVAGALARV